MSKARIEQMLQDCLDGYEAGLTPDECLSAYPDRRVELEPMLRHALSLRIAYATSPSDEFRHQAREQLMFAAGRDVKLALAREPDPSFILQERTRFLNVAGAAAQEALRDVPPPRLAFWVNARRRLLEAASSTAPTPARRFGNALRYSLSAAVIGITIGIVAFASLGGGSTTYSPDAQLAALEQQIIQLEQRRLQGQPVEASELENLADKTSSITDTIDNQDLARAEKIGGLIVRQQDIAKQTLADEPGLVEAQQKLLEAQQKLGGATPTTAAAVIGATEEPAVTATEAPPQPTPEPLRDGEVRVEPASDVTYGLTWQQVTTANFSFVMPENWRLLVDPDEDGVLTLTGSYLALDTGGDDPIIVLITQQGETIARVNGVAPQLRGPGPSADTIAAETLADYFDEVGPPLHHFVLSISLTDAP
jgi:hypothetical protein